MIICTTRLNIKKQGLRPIRCPSCNHGRICDAPAFCQSQTTNNSIKDEADSIIIKCPKCGLSVRLTIE